MLPPGGEHFGPSTPPFEILRPRLVHVLANNVIPGITAVFPAMYQLRLGILVFIVRADTGVNSCPFIRSHR
jgi:hypothetical protein